jgi:hypothetical protein
MANKKSWLGMLVLVLAFGMTVVGCDNGSTDNNGGNIEGTLVLTDIPATYNGKYAYFQAQNSSVMLLGCQSANMSTKTITAIRIANGKVSIPLWIYNESTNSVSRYFGDDIFTQNDGWGVVIYNTPTLTESTEQSDRIATVYFTGAIAFKNGGAIKSVNTGTIIPY